MMRWGRELKVVLLVGVAAFAVACSDSAEADDPMVIDMVEAGGEDCPEGGTTLRVGYDTNGDGEVDEIHSQRHVCDGQDGRDGEDGSGSSNGGEEPPLEIESGEASSEDCEAGGVDYILGYDTNGDGEIDDVVSMETICNGRDGADGQDGTDGTDGEDGSDGQDGADGQDGSDGEDGTDGEDGEDGQDILVESELAPLEACVAEGVVYTFGYDTTGDGEIDEVLDEQTICDGAASPEAVILGAKVLYYDSGLQNNEDDNAYLKGLRELEDEGLIVLNELSDSNDLFSAISFEWSYDVLVYEDDGNALFAPGEVELLGDWLDLGNELVVMTLGNLATNSSAELGFGAGTMFNYDEATFTTFSRLVAGFEESLELHWDINSPWSVELEPADNAYAVCESEQGWTCGVLNEDRTAIGLGFLGTSVEIEPFSAPPMYRPYRKLARNTLATVIAD